MLKAISEGILIDGDIEKEISELEKKLEDKAFYPRLKELLDRYQHNLFLLKKQESLIQNTFIENTVVKTNIIQKRVRSGQKIECEGDVVLLGDLAPGAELMATGNVFIIGNAQGLVHAGVNGDKKAVIVALEMNVNLLKIADVMAKNPDGSNALFPEIVYIDEEGNFVVEEIKNSESFNKYLTQKVNKKPKKGLSKLFRI